MLAAQSSPVSGIVFVVAVLATSILVVAGLAWASRQLLGLPVGTLRAFIAGLVGFVVAYLLGRSLQAAQPGHAVAFFTVVLGVPLIAAMIFIVVAEALVPSGTGPGPVEVIRGVRSAVKRSRRYWQISRIAVRHLPARATARRGRRRRTGSARIVAAAGPGRGRGYVHQAGAVAVHSP
jgi:ubiquinone biosynthesis protein